MKYTKTVRASRNVRPTRSVRASQASRRRVRAEEDFDAPVAPEAEVVEDVTVDEAASELLFEAEDVAELVSEVSGQPVDVTVDDDAVSFTVGEDTYTVTPEGDEEVVEESRRMRRSARSVRAGRQITRRRPTARRVAASQRRPSARRVAASRRVSSARSARR